jgi:hypothetical protein
MHPGFQSLQARLKFLVNFIGAGFTYSSVPLTCLFSDCLNERVERRLTKRGRDIQGITEIGSKASKFCIRAAFFWLSPAEGFTIEVSRTELNL